LTELSNPKNEEMENLSGKVLLFLNAVRSLNDFFSFSLETNHGYGAAKLSFLAAVSSGSLEDQSRVIECVEAVEKRFPKQAVTLEVRRFESLLAGVDFYKQAVNEILCRAYEDDEDFVDEAFDFPRLLEKLKDLSLQDEGASKLEAFVEHATTYSDRDGSGGNLCNFWYHMDQLEEEDEEDDFDDVHVYNHY
jgi:hypothetical protein